MITLLSRKISAFFTKLFPPKYTHKNLIHTQTITAHLKCCSNISSIKSIQALMIKTNTIEDCFLMNQFITACSSISHVNYATLAFTHMKSPNVFVYNALIRGIVCYGKPIQALGLYIQMLRDNVYPTSYTFCSLVKGCVHVLALGFGESLHCQCWKNGFSTHVFVLTVLVDFYGKFGRSGDARKVFDDMPERDSFAWTTMLSVYVQGRDMFSASGLFYEMPERNCTAWNLMIDGYAKMHDVESASVLFDRMPVKDLVSWTTMVTCYSQNKLYKEALAVFDEMMGSRVKPDEITLATVISCCAHLGALNLGKQLHFYVMHGGFCVDVYIGSALIDMYAKCGRLDRSLLVFLNMKEKNLFCWNSIIDGLASHGRGKSALTMFYKMLEANIKPNGVTFISVLSACTHTGLVQEGQEIFQKMIYNFQIYPEIEHYGCMVDLLCKVKLLEEALTLIKSMKIEPNSVVWGALLNGCKICKNIDMAEIAVANLMELEPDNCGYYSLLVHMYAEASRWEEVSKMRTMMREHGVEKECPGCSWIEMENQLHQFIASDKSHYASNDIYMLLNGLNEHLKLLPSVDEIEDAL